MKNITFINAGAGSGKTYTLTDRLVKCIQNKECQANQVLLTTFTDKAAGEFKSKAREALIAAGMPDQANLLASAAIGTVHSVAYQLIRNYWYHLGLTADLNVMPKEDVHFFLSQAISGIPTADELRQLREIAAQLSFPGAMNSVNENLWKEDLLKIIEIALTNRILDMKSCKQNSIAELNRIYPLRNTQIDKVLIAQQLNQLNQILPNEKESGAREKRINTVKDLLAKKELAISDLFRIRSFFEDLGVKLQQKVSNIDTTMQQLADLQYTEPVIKYLRSYISIVFDLAQRSINKFRDYKLEQKLVDFNDMEAYLLKLLEIPDVAADISNRCKRLFVDEFQDSSPIQVSIFIKLAEIADHSYWVGDPKQAIFNFRGTDPLLISSIINEFGKKDDRNLVVENLDRSWRSRPELVELSNKIFKNALADQVPVAEHIALTPVRPGNEIATDVTGFPLRHWHITNESNKVVKKRFDDNLSGLVSGFLKEDKRQVIDKEKSSYSPDKKEYHTMPRQMNPKDVAILRYANDDISSLVSSLKREGVKASAQQKALCKTAEIQLLLAALNFLLDENDSLAMANLLLLGGEFKTTGELIDDRLRFVTSLGDAPETEADEENAALKEYYEKLQQWHGENDLLVKINIIREQAGRYDVPGLVQAVINLSGLSDLVLRWDVPDQRQSNLQTAVKQAITYDERCLLLNIGASVRGFMDYITSFEEDELGQSASQGKDSVNILTYHKSKGLEWPVVILTDLNEDFMDENKMMRRSFHGVSRDNPEKIDIKKPFEGQSVILLPWPFGQAKNPPEDVANNIRETDRFNRIRQLMGDETKRLLYVGMTRARDYLITTSSKGSDLKWFNMGLGHSNTMTHCEELTEGLSKSDLFEKGCDILIEKVAFETQEEEIQGEGADNETDNEISDVSAYKRSELSKNDDPRFRSPSSSPGSKSAKVEILKNFDHRIQTGKIAESSEADLGNCLHAIFYQYRTGIDRELFIQKAQTLIKNFGFTGLLPYPEHIYESVRNLWDHLTEKYGEPVEVYKELPLQMEEDGYVWRGSADLVWETEKGLILIDYKSFPGKIDHILNPENEKFSGMYSGQLGTYREMIDSGHPGHKKVTEALIYYSVIGVIIKIS